MRRNLYNAMEIRTSRRKYIEKNLIESDAEKIKFIISTVNSIISAPMQ